MPKKTPEEIADENERTNERGLFDYADSFLACARQLIDNPPPDRRFEPIHFLLSHAAELYLKSYLRQKGEDVETLRNLGHSLRGLCEKATTYGISLPLHIHDTFAFLDETGANREQIYSDRL